MTTIQTTQMFYRVPLYLFSIVFLIHEHELCRPTLELESSSNIVIERFFFQRPLWKHYCDPESQTRFKESIENIVHLCISLQRLFFKSIKPESCCNFRKIHLNSNDFFSNSRFYGLLVKNIRVMLNSSCNWPRKRFFTSWKKKYDWGSNVQGPKCSHSHPIVKLQSCTSRTRISLDQVKIHSTKPQSRNTFNPEAFTVLYRKKFRVCLQHTFFLF